MPRCNICNCNLDDPAHDVSPKHIKNLIFYNYSQRRKAVTGNRKGIIISCDAESATNSFLNNMEDKIVISTKPDEDVKFNFKVLNETNAEDILVVGIDIATEKINFTMKEHPFVFGEDPFNLSPKQSIPEDVQVTFSSPNMGKYNMPIIFFFSKTINNESLVIVRDMVVFVETESVVHEDIETPYRNKELFAKNFMHANITIHRGNFPVPKNYKAVFRTALQTPANASEQDAALYNTVSRSFEIGVTEDNYSTFFHNLLWYEEFVAKSHLRRYNMCNCPLELITREIYRLHVPGLAEKRPSLMKGDIVKVKPQDHDVIFEGVVVAIEDNYVNVEHFCDEFHQMFRSQHLFDIAFVMGRVPLERMHSAVHKLGEVGQMSRVFPQPNPHPPRVSPIQNWYNPVIGANLEQRAAVERIVRGAAGLAPYILHGPPGTGKTLTVVEAVLQLLKSKESNRILVCTESNMAADHVACMLIKYSSKFPKNFLVRANSKFRDMKCLPKALEPYSNCYPDTVKMVQEYRIVVSTLSHAAFYSRGKHPISHLFIDEAAQASEPACLVPLAALLDRAGAVVLAGDHMQLGPVVISHDAARKGLAVSLMERLIETCPLYKTDDQNYTVMLRNNFRSHPDILEIPNRLFYDNQLVPLAKVDPLSSTDILGKAKQSRAIVFHGCSSKEQRIGKSPSYYNEMELKLVQEYILALTHRHNVQPADIGVVTPYYRQVIRVKSWLENRKLDAIEVGTVESFQGKEKRVIIISTVRANCGLLDHDAKFNLGFLVDDKRFNVALTRAKAKAIIVGNPLCLREDEKWKLYMQKCRDHRTYFGFDTVLERNSIITTDLMKCAKKINDLFITND